MTRQPTQQELRRRLEEQAAAGDEGARFALHSLRTRTNADRRAAVEAWAKRAEGRA